jgi:hypothetical protein
MKEDTLMKQILVASIVVIIFMLTALPGLASNANDNACWGQASAVFAQMGEMGEHSSSQSSPRLGLRNLARFLAEQGVIPDDSMRSLGIFVATELGLEIDACMD